MVFFVCEGCNESLKKNQVDKHAGHCRSCWAVTCVDCNVTFPGDEYRAHTACISEEQRYQGKLYKAPKVKVKRNPQEIWTHVVEDAAANVNDAPQALRSFIAGLTGYGNVPRNEKKFGNFVKNSLNVRSEATIKALWDYLTAMHKAAQDEQAADLAGAVAGGGGGKGGAAEGGAKRKQVGEEKAEDEEEAGSGGEAKKPKKDKKEKKGKAGLAEAEVASGDVEAAAALVSAASVGAWGKAITKALKGAPGRAMENKALRKAAAAAVAEATGVAEGGKAETKAAFKAALAALPKVTEAGGVVTYSKAS